MTSAVFRHDDDGTPESVWVAELARRRIGSLDVTGFDALVAVAAHPDDETLGAGGLLNVAARLGLAITIVVATDGEASHPHSAVAPADLAVRRRHESGEAAGIVAPGARMLFAGLPDGELAAHRDALARILTPLTAPRTLIAAPFAGDAHPDHAAAASAASAAAAETGATAIEYPIWLWHWGAPDDVPWNRLRELELDAQGRAAKAGAMAAHRSQTEPLGDGAGDARLLHPRFLAHFARPAELFVLTDPITPPAADPARFEEMLEGEPDPWGTETRWYERRKRDVLLASLPAERLGDVLELGCSTGVLSTPLAERAATLLGVDVAPTAVQHARARNAHLPGARFEVAQLPGEWPAGTFDLIVVSELAYYLGTDERRLLLERTLTALRPGGTVVVCHWRHPMHDSATTGDAAAAEFASHPELGVLARHEEEDFVLLVLQRPPIVSIARAEGLAP